MDDYVKGLDKAVQDQHTLKEYGVNLLNPCTQTVPYPQEPYSISGWRTDMILFHVEATSYLFFDTQVNTALRNGLGETEYFLNPFGIIQHGRSFGR